MPCYVFFCDVMLCCVLLHGVRRCSDVFYIAMFGYVAFGSVLLRIVLLRYVLLREPPQSFSHLP
eukprot:9222975-Pyramimonas_sp.AAC.1